jgi:prephenate dehydrogenase
MLKATLIGFGRFGKLFYKFFKDDFLFQIIDKNIPSSEIRKQTNLLDNFPIQESKIIFLAVPISQIESVAKELKDQVSSDCVIVEFCSVQTYPIQILKKEFPNNLIFAIHPLFGPDSVENSLENHIAVIIENEEVNSSVEYLKKLFKSKGVRLISMSDEDHDKLIAWTLCLTQFIGRSLGKLNLPETEIATRGFIELMNIVRRSNADTEQLFIDMNKYNPYAKEMREKVISAFNEINQYLNQII